jgi:hypothetical protein
MQRWPWRKGLVISSCVVIVVGFGPLAFVRWFAAAHNFRPVSMQLPLKQGEYNSPEFKTDLDENYMVQIELMDSTNRSIGLNQNAVLDLDWKIVDSGGAIIQQGTQNAPMRGASSVNLGEYHPKRGLRQTLIVSLHRDFEEPPGTHVTLEVNSTEDPEGMAAAYYLSCFWAVIVAGSSAIFLLVLLIRRIARTSSNAMKEIS